MSVCRAPESQSELRSSSVEREGLAQTDSAARQAGKRLLRATRSFAVESRTRSWWSLASTLVLLVAAMVAAASTPWIAGRVAASVLSGLLMVRTFVLYHDFMHGAILRRSRLAKAIFYTFGMIAVTPPRSWRESHNFHHAHVGELEASHVGSFPVMTTDAWQRASFWQRVGYRISRHPLTILAGYVTVFLVSICVGPLLRNPRKSWDSALSLLMHTSLLVAVGVFAGLPALCFSLLLPMMIAAALGGYLFYAQHNVEQARGLSTDEWSYFRGALESSSYMKLGPLMNWFTANIGYHHIHHVNPLIPFYRLPEAMAALPELQQPIATSLRPRDVLSCLRLGLWDPRRQRMVTYREARRAETQA